MAFYIINDISFKIQIENFTGPYKELGLPRERLARELVDKLECGYRLEQPNNCSQELYQELLNCK